MSKPKKLIIFLFFIIILAALSGCIRNPQPKPLTPKTSSVFEKAEVEWVEVIKDTAYIRSGNSTDYPVVSTVHMKDTLEVEGSVGKWHIVILDDGRVGAISPHDVTPIVKEIDSPMLPNNIKDLTPNESEMLRLLNAERSKVGLKPLMIDLQITEIARYKAQDMIDNDYFSHYSPSYGSPFEMLHNYGIKYIYAGENLAGNDSVESAHESLMESEGHKENILNPEFTHVGIGVKEGSKYGKIFTQIFITK